MFRSTRILMVVPLLAGLALRANAQSRGLVEVGQDTRAGFYITGGLGDGLDQIKFTDQSQFQDWHSSPAAVLRIGGTPSQNVRIGAEFFGWWHSYDDVDFGHVTEYFTAAMLEGQFYVAPRSGLYLKGGIGIGHSGSNYDDYDYGDVGSNGFAFTVGAGYDVPLSPWISIAPTVDFYQSTFSNAPDPNTGLSNSYTEHVLNIGASLTFQTRHRRF